MTEYKINYPLQKMLKSIVIMKNDKNVDLKISGKLQKIITYIDKLHFEDRPDYASMISILNKCKHYSMNSWIIIFI